ncbi:hypothetical protein [Cellulomonas sp. KRMCY2]|uniref:hypothetical protein n=1 Tax=Cellulomonas sp. KRMCY2 TaxID=1304865 RepID=UPI00045E688A|nr:hypothetical protein [Cellulomonas sp. KRMCY2]
MAMAACSRSGCGSRPGRKRAVSAAISAVIGATLVLASAGCAGTVPAADQAPVPAARTTPPAVAAPKAESVPQEPLVTSTPDAHSEVGELVTGFPVDLLPVPADAVILVTSAVPVGDADVQEVSLNLRTVMSAEDLLALYRDALTVAGFTEVPAVDAMTDLAVEATFTRSGGDELISIGVLDVDGARTVTIGGRVHTQT